MKLLSKSFPRWATTTQNNLILCNYFSWPLTATSPSLGSPRCSAAPEAAATAVRDTLP
jgi:hypothetical protein